MSNITKADTKQLWKVSYPLMISFMSTFLMLFVDRLFLSFYDKEALNASAVSGTLAWSLIVAWITLAALAEVFVAQYNGAKRYRELSHPVWQMIWLSLVSILFFGFSAGWLSHMIYPSEKLTYQRDYFQWLMIAGPFGVALSGISAFYIGQGKAQIVKWLSILGNVVNIVLDPILIFGIDGFIPSMGIKGAAIATCMGYIVQTSVIIILFLSKKNRTQHNTGDCAFRLPLFKMCLRVGAPPAIFAGLEILAWALFYSMMEKVSPEHIFVCSVCQSIEMLFLFFCFGLEKGVAAIAGNLIGAGLQDRLTKLASSAFKLIFYFSIAVILLFVVYPDPMIDLFFAKTTSSENITILQRFAVPNITEYKPLIKNSLIFISAYMIIESIRWLYSGILTAAGDTLYLMITGTISVWLFLLLPCYFVIMVGQKSIIYAFSIWVLYSIITSLLNYLRFLSGAWKSKIVIDSETQIPSDTPIEPTE